MAFKIQRIDYKRLRREEQHSYNHDALRIIDQTCGPCGKLYEAYRRAVSVFDEALIQKALQPSRSLADHDAAADGAWVGLQYRIKAGLYLPRTKEAAAKVDAIFSQTSNPTHLGYAQAYGAMRTLLSQLGALGDETLIEADVKEHVDYLQSCVDNFLAKRSELMTAHSSGRIGEISVSVKECAQSWQTLAGYIESMANAEALDHADETVAQLNSMTLLYKARIEARLNNDDDGGEKGEKEAAETSEEEEKKEEVETSAPETVEE